MKKNVTYVSYAAVVALVEASGLTVSEKANWLKVMGQKGRRLYVPKCKNVGRVDLVGFADQAGVVNLGGEGFGSVTHQLDMSRPEADVLATLAGLLDQLRTLEALEPAPRRRAPRAEPAPAPVDREARRAARVAKVRSLVDFSKKSGLPLSASSPSLCADEDITQEEVDALLSE